jgi:hypothetical protein
MPKPFSNALANALATYAAQTYFAESMLTYTLPHKHACMARTAGQLAQFAFQQHRAIHPWESQATAEIVLAAGAW